MEIPDIKNYIHYKSREHYLGEDSQGIETTHPLAHADYYESEDKTFSIGLYTFDKQNLFIAWGKKGSCDYHAILFTNPPVIGEGCIDFTMKDNEIIFKEGEKTYTYHIA